MRGQQTNVRCENANYKGLKSNFAETEWGECVQSIDPKSFVFHITTCLYHHGDTEAGWPQCLNTDKKQQSVKSK